MANRKPILMGQAQVIDLVQPQVRRMLEAEGIYIGTDSNAPEFEVPMVVMQGKVYSLNIDRELDPELFKDSLQLVGPFRAAGVEKAKPPRATEQPRPMASAPRDGTLLRLLVRFTEHATDDAAEAWTIGSNSFDANGEDEWQFAGWCWDHDHFTEGKGTPIGWLPMLTERTAVSEAWRPALRKCVDCLASAITGGKVKVHQATEAMQEAETLLAAATSQRAEG